MNRRTLIAAGTLAAAALATGASAQTHSHGAHGEKSPLATSSLDCVDKGRACLSHCFELIKGGDTSIVECAREVNELIVACQALHVLAVAKSKNLVSFAKAVKAICSSCEAECMKHASKHAECKACAESCAACIKEIERLG